MFLSALSNFGTPCGKAAMIVHQLEVLHGDAGQYIGFHADVIAGSGIIQRTIEGSKSHLHSSPSSFQNAQIIQQVREPDRRILYPFPVKMLKNIFALKACNLLSFRKQARFQVNYSFILLIIDRANNV